MRLTINTPPIEIVGAASPERAVHGEIDRLATLAPNWDGYGAPALNRDVLEAARQFISRVASHITVQPMVVPLSSGALQFEWHKGQKILELEVEDATTIHYLKWHPAEGIQEEDAFPIGDTARATSLIDWFTPR